MSVYIHFNLEEVERHLDHLEKAPTAKDKVKLKAILNDQLKLVVDFTHVKTGSLKSSMTAEDKTVRSKWYGTIEAGGPSLGVNNPVDYAIYEYRRGGHHNFMALTKTVEKFYIQAIKEIFSD